MEKTGEKPSNFQGPIIHLFFFQESGNLHVPLFRHFFSEKKRFFQLSTSFPRKIPSARDVEWHTTTSQAVRLIETNPWPTGFIRSTDPEKCAFCHSLASWRFVNEVLSLFLVWCKWKLRQGDIWLRFGPLMVAPANSAEHLRTALSGSPWTKSAPLVEMF